MNQRRSSRTSAAIFALALSSLVVLSCGDEPEALSAPMRGQEGPALKAHTGGPVASDPRLKGGKALYWGATIGDQLTGEQAPFDMGAVSAFERIAGKGLSLIEFYVPFADCSSGQCEPYAFPTTPLENIRKHGAIPVLSWSSDSSPPNVRQPNYQLSDVISGRHDRHIRDWAVKAKAWGHPFFLRFDWEMNGFWFPWAADANGNRPAQYIAAWRHVHRIFTSIGATNATWVWCPNVDFTRKLQNLRSVYPGNRYVDWTCLDGFNWGARKDSAGWMSFDEIYRSTYRRVVKIAPRKPMLLGEVASTEVGGSKAAWIKNMLHMLANGYSKVRGFLWFDVNDRGANWPIESSRSASRAFANGIRDPAYVSNRYGDIAGRPIRPPRR